MATYEDPLDGMEDLFISDETTASIKSGEALARGLRNNALAVLALADKADDYANKLRRLSMAYAQLAREIHDDIGLLIDREWDLEEDPPTDEEPSDG